MQLEAHRRAIRESLETLEECVQRGIQERQRTIGFHCSAAAVDFLELYLHTQHLIDPGASLKHDFFSSERKARERLPVKFAHKEEILALLFAIESKRNLLCYGKPQPRETIEEVLGLFNRFREQFEQLGVRYE